MKELNISADMENSKKVDRYPGLWSFTQSQSDIFFGREQEKRELFQMVKNNIITVLFAKSGIGKSSLLNAGVVPLLISSEYTPVNILFTKTLQDSNQQMEPLKLFKTTLQEWAGKRQSPFTNNQEKIWEYFKTCVFPLRNIPVLIFDQFEELFSYPLEQIRDFLVELSELSHELPPSRVIGQLLDVEKENRTEEHIQWITQPSVKFIFAIRSDRLSDLQKVDNLILGIFDNRYQLLPMAGQNAALAITKPAENNTTDYFSCPTFTYDELALKKIIDNLKDNYTGEIEPSQLQIICRYIEELVKTSYINDNVKTIKRVTLDEFNADVETDEVLHNYYEKQLAQIGSASDQALCRQLLENDLLEKSNDTYIRPRLSEGKVKERLHNNTTLLNMLLIARLIKVEMDEGITYYQLSHDSLKDPILKAKIASEELERSIIERNAQIQEAKDYVLEHYTFLREKNYEKALESLTKANLIFERISEKKDSFEAKILMAKVYESQNYFKEAAHQLNEILRMLDENHDLPLLGIVNECLGVIESKQGNSAGEMEKFEKALAYYNMIPDYQQKARISEHIGSLKEQLFYNLDLGVIDEATVKQYFDASNFFYTNASQAYLFVNDTIGYVRTGRSITRLNGYFDEIRKPGFTAKPWGYLTELFSGEMHLMKGKGVIRIGRDVYDASTGIYTLKNEVAIDDPHRLISRRHAVITPDLFIEDTQSLNGTTINNEQVYYGSPKKLQDGDIVVLSNFVPLRFTITEPKEIATYKDCWAIIIDGLLREIHSLANFYSTYSLNVEQVNGMTNFKLVIEEGDSDEAIIKFRINNSRYQFFIDERIYRTYSSIDNITNKNIGIWKVSAIVKDGRDFISVWLKTDEWYSIDYPPIWYALYFCPMESNLFATTEPEAAYASYIEGPRFQLIINQH